MRIRRLPALAAAALVLTTACSRSDAPSGGNAEREPEPSPAPTTEATPDTSAGLPASPEDPTLTVVADPRPGDLRSDPGADVLPADYVAPQPATTTLDLAYGPDPEHRLDLYLPGDGPAPVVLYLAGGGWGAGARVPVPEMVLRFVERGYALATVGFRSAPDHPFPAAVEDVKRAVRWLKTEGPGERLVDGDRIVAYGASSGGILAALVATTPGRFEPADPTAAALTVDSTVAGLVALVAPTDLVALFEDPHPWALGAVQSWLGCAPCTDERLVEASPITYLTDGLPPAYWAYGELDPIAAPAAHADIVTRWGALAGADSSWLDVVEGGAHNLDQTMVNQRELERFVDRVAGPGSPPASAITEPRDLDRAE